MEILKIAAVILISTILVSSLPTFDKSITSLITLSTSIVVLFYVISSVRESVELIYSVVDKAQFSDFSLVFRAMGVSLLTQFVSDIAADSGNKALANQMIFVGKVAIVIIALPVFIQVLEIIGNLIR